MRRRQGIKMSKCQWNQTNLSSGAAKRWKNTGKGTNITCVRYPTTIYMIGQHSIRPGASNNSLATRDGDRQTSSLLLGNLQPPTSNLPPSYIEPTPISPLHPPSPCSSGSRKSFKMDHTSEMAPKFAPFIGMVRNPSISRMPS